MPRISFFFGLSIYMYFGDHNPPHFHVTYNEYAAMIDIKTGEIISGKLPVRALSMIQEWTEANCKQLMLNWEKAQRNEELEIISPLE